MTSAISFTGLASGIDTASIIANLMKLERRPIARLEAERSNITARQSVMKELGGLLGAARNAARNLHSPTALLSAGASTTNDTVAQVSASEGAQKGSYNLTVHSLARNHTMASDIGATLTAGASLDITAAGDTRSIQVQEGDTLMSFAARINATEGVAASASVIDGRLVLNARTSGTAHALTLGGDAATELNLATAQDAQDATFDINGIAVTRASNTIGDAIAGTNVTLTGVGSTTIAVGLDTDAATAEARTFIKAYNDLMMNLRASTAYDPATGTAGTLQGDQIINLAMSRLRNLAGSAVSGVAGAGTLASVGISAGRDGLLSLDAERFAAALSADPDEVRAVFGASAGGTGDGIARRLGALADDIATHSIGARANSYTDALGRIDRKVTDLEHLLTLREQSMRGQWEAMERAVMTFQSQGSYLGSYLNHLV